jgi:hypothetical protein
MSQQREHERARVRPITRWVVLGAALLLMVALAGYVALLNRQVRDGDVQWRYQGDGPVRVMSVGERFLVVDEGARTVVLDRSDGTKVMKLDFRERGFAVGDAVLASGESGYRLLSRSGEELWSQPTASGTSVAPVAADVESGQAVLLEQREEGADVLRGIDLARGTVSWRRTIDQYGDDPFAIGDLQQVERVRLLPVQLPGQESLTVLSPDGEQLHTGIEVDSSPFVPHNGRALVVDEQGCSESSVITAGQPAFL